MLLMHCKISTNLKILKIISDKVTTVTKKYHAGPNSNFPLARLGQLVQISFRYVHKYYK